MILHDGTLCLERSQVASRYFAHVSLIDDVQVHLSCASEMASTNVVWIAVLFGGAGSAYIGLGGAGGKCTRTVCLLDDRALICECCEDLGCGRFGNCAFEIGGDVHCAKWPVHLWWVCM